MTTPNPQPLADLGPRATQESLLELWPPLAPLEPPPPALPAYPLELLPTALAAPMAAACRLSRGSLGMSSLAFHSSLALTAAADFDVVHPRGTGQIPLTFFTLGIAASGWRKSSIAGDAFAPHYKADAELSERHQKAREAYRRWEKSGEGAEPPRPTEDSPHRLRKDATAEAVLRLLSRSTLNLALFNADAAAAIGNWSNRAAERGRSQAIYAGLFDGEPTDSERVKHGGTRTATNARLTICWLTQPGPGTEYLLSDSSENGFAARCLTYQDFVRPAGPETARPAPEERRQLAATLNQFQHTIHYARWMQDGGREVGYWKEGDDPPRYPAMETATPRHHIPMLDEALPAFDAFVDEMERASDKAHYEGKRIKQGCLVRAPEMACRIAGCYAALQAYTDAADRLLPGPELPPAIGIDQMRAAVAVVRWHLDALDAITDRAGFEEATEAAKDLGELLRESYQEREATHKRFWKEADGHYTVELNTLVQSRGRGQHSGRLRKDVTFRQQVIAVLADVGYVQMITRGRWAIHPDMRV